ncbi:MAG: GGDEF domain-containing response regulator [Methylobacter sp.]
MLLEQLNQEHDLLSALTPPITDLPVDIVLLEDGAELAKNISEQLGFYGFRVHSCTSLDELRVIFSNLQPAALLVNLELPGDSLASPLIALCLVSICLLDVPIIFISASDDWAARLAAVRAGASAFFTKPLDYGILANRLSHLTDPGPQEKIRVLIVEDQTEPAQHYAAVLRGAGMLVEILAQPSEIIQTIAQLQPDLILMDLYMPDCTGFELTGIIRQIEAYQGISIVLLSTEPVKEKQRAIMRIGGDDFLSKPISDEDLVYAVSHRAERFKYLNSLMLRDSLTGLLNHAALKSQLETLHSQSLRTSSMLSFVMIDIDLFKTINDRYGHPKGDIVIRSLANLLKKRLRKADVIGRYGGEEFAVILQNTEQAQAVKIINDLREGFEKISHFHQGVIFHATFSAGIATTPPCLLMQELIGQADQALYAAKQQGRNQVKTYSKIILEG